MIGFSLVFAACVSYWLTPISAPSADCIVNPPLTSQKLTRLVSNSPSLDPLYERSRTITVRIKTGRNGGSGILVQRQAQLYTVLTNRHVTTVGAPYVIQTPDGRSHPASLLKKVNFRGNDLALLQFRARGEYAIAPLGSANQATQGDPVIAAGFPLEPVPMQHRGFLVTVGKIALLPDQAFQGGYQIGYTNLIHQGMSGGPVLNLRGEVIGINSLHAYPLWGDPYIFQDGSKPSPAQRQIIAQTSWAVPIDTFRQAIGSKQPATRQNQKL